MDVLGAVMRGNVEEARKLLNHENINNRYLLDTTLLHLAASSGPSEMVELLLKLGADVNQACSEYQNTPLHDASRGKRDKVVEILIRNGADINCKTKFGETPMHLAVKGGRVVVEILLKNGADINSKDVDGKTPLHLAVEGENIEVCRILVQNGAEINIKDARGRTPLHCAAVRVGVGIVDILLSSGADVNSRDEHGQTPLHYNICTGVDPKIVTTLLHHGADVNSQGQFGDALHAAIEFNQAEVIPILLEYRADNQTIIDFAFRCNNDWFIRHLVDTLEIHFIKLDALRQVVGAPAGMSTPPNSLWDHQRRNRWLQRCLKELETLNERIGSTDFTYSDVLVQNVAALRDSNVERFLSNDNHLARFPIYGNLIDIRFEFRHHRRLLDRVIALLSGKGYFSRLPPELIEMICCNLKDCRDLRKIIRIFDVGAS